MNKIRMEPVQTEEEIKTLAGLAHSIWHEYFPAILTEEQIDYMVERFQSVSAMTQQIREQGYQYYFLAAEGQPAGYCGICPDGSKLFLSKLYLKKEHRGKGYASQAFAFLEEFCEKNGYEAIWLTVNRFNEATIAAYKKKGFTIVGEQKADIGHGFIMDDYVMEKALVERAKDERESDGKIRGLVYKK